MKNVSVELGGTSLKRRTGNANPTNIFFHFTPELEVKWGR